MENEICAWLALALGVPVGWLRLDDAPGGVALMCVETVDAGSFTDVLGRVNRRVRLALNLTGYGKPPRFHVPDWWLDDFGTPESVVLRKWGVAADKKHPDDRDRWTGEVEVTCRWTE